MWKKDLCHANSSELGFTCFNRKLLEQMKQLWNIKHPDMSIDTNDSKEIWQAFKYIFRTSCKRESCWLNKHFLNFNLDTTLLKRSFAPAYPESWKKNPYQWLTGRDITHVMKQYEEKHSDFEFLGPSPINYDTIIEDSECVWNELCRFNLLDYLKRKIRIIGIIFNIDKHTKKGSHWISLIIDTNKGELYFFDSYGFRIHPKVNSFAKDVIKQSKLIDHVKDFKRYSNTIDHQLITDSECGIYCLYIIINLIKGEDFHKLVSKRIPDGRIRNLRKVYFNY